MSLREGIKSGGCAERGLRDNKGSSGNCQVTCTSSGKVAGTGQCFLGNDRGTGNTMCFQPGVCWGMGVVLHFDTGTLTITSRGFYTVFGHTLDGVEAQKFKPIPYPYSMYITRTSYIILHIYFSILKLQIGGAHGSHRWGSGQGLYM